VLLPIEIDFRHLVRDRTTYSDPAATPIPWLGKGRFRCWQSGMVLILPRNPCSDRSFGLGYCHYLLISLKHFSSTCWNECINRISLSLLQLRFKSNSRDCTYPISRMWFRPFSYLLWCTAFMVDGSREDWFGFVVFNFFIFLGQSLSACIWDWELDITYDNSTVTKFSVSAPTHLSHCCRRKLRIDELWKTCNVRLLFWSLILWVYMRILIPYCSGP